MPRAIELEQVGKSYAGVPALAEVDLGIEEGEFVAVVGPSGCGKTTLLNVIAGIEPASEGRVVLLGNDLAALSDDGRSDLRLRSVGFVFQSFNLFPSFTARENVAWPMRFLGCRWRVAKGRAAETLARVGLSHSVCDRRPTELSGGEQQRVAIARALAPGPRVLLADEPTGNLDSRTAAQILALLAELSAERGLTIVLVTHNGRAASCAHRIVRFRDGRVDGGRLRAIERRRMGTA